jgi:acetyl-CoA carboxylase, biotin carboxylase subunit
VPPFYDSLLGKLIVWDETRAKALDRLARALGELEIGGIKTTAPLHQALLRDEAVRSGAFHTKFLEPWLEARSAELVQQEEVVDG